MATAQESGSGGLASAAASARDFVGERLRETDSPMSPSELAEEYGCSSAHMSNICSELNQSGEIERVETGQYVDGEASSEGVDEPESEQSDSGSEDSPGLAAEPSDESVKEQGEGSSEQDSVPSADGEARSEDPDTEGEDAPSDRDAALVAAGTSAAAGVPMMLPKLDGRQLAMLGAGALVVYFVFIRDSGGDEEPAEDQQREAVSGGGLIGDYEEEEEQDESPAFDGHVDDELWGSP
jgi:hypothetical protein